jgi:hypothetical protein
MVLKRESFLLISGVLKVCYFLVDDTENEGFLLVGGVEKENYLLVDRPWKEWYLLFFGNVKEGSLRVGRSVKEDSLLVGCYCFHLICHFVVRFVTIMYFVCYNLGFKS